MCIRDRRYSPLHMKYVYESNTYKQIYKIPSIFRKNLIIFYMFLRNLFNDRVFVYYLFYTLCALASITIHRLFASLLLYDMVWRNPVLIFVIQSVWRPKKTMGMTFILFLIAIIIYATLAYYLYFEDVHGYCDTLWVCMVRFMDQSFKQNAGIGSYIDVLDGTYQEKNPEDKGGVALFGETQNTPEIRWGRVLYDFTSFFIPVVIIIQIVTGVIADTFEVLRNEEEERTNDMNNVCYICGFDRDFIQEKMRNQEGFITHVKEDHYLWHYFFYIAYIEVKDKTEYTGHESYIAECLQTNSLAWFPINKGISLGTVEEECDKDPAVVLQDLQKTLDEVDKKIEHVQKTIEEAEERKERTNNKLQLSLIHI
eukprot:TRINITY_DN311_c0_g3_i5.p1 TRINITY_DN311_c0_g3~~TRINITY_DN311_c0_g3_i5.p1  ORF type:complete len:368 (+),score=50.02 TRINITY_DN311_c0_g3_i5:67-1170(+)